MLSPLLKWVGGKGKLLHHIIPKLRDAHAVNNYYEPFVGGGSVLFAVVNEVKEGNIQMTGKIYASDSNKDLILFYRTVVSHPEELAISIQELFDNYNQASTLNGNRFPATLELALATKESYYYWIRKSYNDTRSESMSQTQPQSDSIKRSALLYFLNKTCFRGIYREGPNGFNVPFGNYKTKFTPPTASELNEYSESLQNVIFSVAHFQESLSECRDGDLVYADPPYAPVQKTSFVGYTKDGFGLDAHITLFSLLHSLREKKVSVVMSNADVEMVRESFSPDIWNYDFISARRAVNSKNPESTQLEVIIY
jgi:DNA adenine methylase